MKNLKLLNKKYFSIIFIFLFFGLSVLSEEPVDIWNLEEKKKIEENTAVKDSKKKVFHKTLSMKCNPKKMIN